MTRIDELPAFGDRRPIPPPPPQRRSEQEHRSVVEDGRPHADPAPNALVRVRPWIDPLVDETGHDPRSRYVEQFWLGVLGPTATWVLRRLVTGFEQHPDGYDIDLTLTARSMGLSYAPGRSSPFSKAMQRCTMFGLSHQTGDGIAVRRRVPMVAHRHLRRMPDAVQEAHARWDRSNVAVDAFARAHRLALAMLESGDDATVIEHHLVAVGTDAVTAAEVADNACRL
ncbi:MAG: hypothetical protein AB8G14_04280 [Ilumatobacter sp.]